MLTADRLRELFQYDPETGEWQRLPRNDVRPCWISRYVNKPVGTISPTTGYLIINIDKHLYRAHRLAWLYAYGEWPAKDLDHKDGNRLNNKISNLREAEFYQNRANQKTRSDSKSGIKGVSFHKKARKWRARVRLHGMEIHLGLFDTPEAAQKAYIAEANRVFGEFARYA